MGIRKEFICLAHGAFVSDKPVCEHGCTLTVERAFFTAPAAISKKTQNTDRILRTLASDFGLSDMSNRDGKAVKSAKPQGIWGEVPSGDRFVAGKGVEHVKGAGRGAEAAAEASHVYSSKVPGEVSFLDMSKQMVPPRPIVDPKLSYGSAADLQAAVKAAA